MAARCAHSAVLPGHAARHASADCVGHTVDQPTPGLLSSNAAPAVLLSPEQNSALTPARSHPVLAHSSRSSPAAAAAAARCGAAAAAAAVAVPTTPLPPPLAATAAAWAWASPAPRKCPVAPQRRPCTQPAMAARCVVACQMKCSLHVASPVLQQMTAMQAASVPTLHAADLGCRCPPSCCCADGSTADDGHAGGVCWIRPGGHDAGGSHDGSYAR